MLQAILLQLCFRVNVGATIGGARGVMVIVVGNGHGDTRLMAFHITLIPLGNIWIQLFSLQLWVNRLGFSAMVRQLVKEKENSEFKPVKLHLKIDLVSYPARAEGLVNMVNMGATAMKGVLTILQISKAATSPTDGLISSFAYSLGGGRLTPQ